MDIEKLGKIAGLTGVAGLALGGINAIQNIRRGKKQQEQGQALYETMLKDLRSKKYDATVSQAALQSADEQKRLAAQSARNAQQRALAAQSSYMAGIRSGDRRMAAAVPSVISGIEAGTQQADIAAAREQAAATQGITALQEQYKQENLARQIGLSELEMERGAAGAEAGAQQVQSGWNSLGGMIGDVSTLFTQIADLNKAERGAKVKKTPGQFSHKNNPIHMVANDGRKVGEVTGGEYVFNPEQSNKMNSFLKEGDKEGLFVYMKDLLSKERFK